MTQIHLPKKLELETLPARSCEGRFSTDAEHSPEKRIRLNDPETGKAWGFVVVDNTCRGPGLGGIRMAEDVTLTEIARLARAMTLKNSAACVPFGGGKSGLAVDPQFFRQAPESRRHLIALLAEALFPVDSYITAPDMGTDEADIQQIYEYNSEKMGTPVHPRGGAARPPEKGGVPIDAWGLTAHGLFAAAKTMEPLQGGFPLKNARVVIQGYGNVGSYTASKLSAEGALIVGASDIHAALWHPRGLNVEELNSVRRETCGLQGYSGAVKKRFTSNQVDWLLEAPCDILVPAARPDAITAKNADRIQCRMILQGANTPSNRMTEYYLQNRRGILSLSDFIVNVGGVIGCAVELKMTGNPAYKEKVFSHGIRRYVEELIFSTVSKNVLEIHNRLASQKPKDIIFREEALKLAEERLRTKEEWL